jgi:hypothetical protein
MQADDNGEPPLVFTAEEDTPSPDDYEDYEGWDGEPFSWEGGRQALEFGLIDTRNITRVSRLCGFTLPDLRGMTFQDMPCLGYRCSFTSSNLMRNSSIDTSIVELAFRNASQVLAPWFRTRHLTFLMQLSAEFQRRVERGGRPKCVWYDRYLNQTSSSWSDEGCRVLAYNTSHVQCACSHLTEFSIMVADVKRPIRPPILIIGLCILAAVVLIFVAWKLYRNPKYVKDWFGPMPYERRIRPNRRHTASTIRMPPARSISRSTLIVSGASASGSTIFETRPRTRTGPTMRSAERVDTLRRSKSQMLWSRHDDEVLRRERINLILGELEDGHEGESGGKGVGEV